MGKPGKTVRQLKGIENHVKSGLGEQQFFVGSLTLHILVGLSQALFLEMTSHVADPPSKTNPLQLGFAGNV